MALASVRKFFFLMKYCGAQTIGIASDKDFSAQTVVITVDKDCDAQTDGIAVDERKR